MFTTESSGTFGIVTVNEEDPSLVTKTQSFILDEEFISEPFIRECTFLSSYVHPNIIALAPRTAMPSTGNATRRVKLIMENGGITLTKWVESTPKEKRKKQIIPILYQITQGLNAMHEEHMIYGDLSPNNVVIDNNLHVRIIDFGSIFFDSTIFKNTRLVNLAKNFYRCQSCFTSPEMSILFMSRRQKNNLPLHVEEWRLTPKHDIYSLGLIARHIWTGEIVNPNSNININDVRLYLLVERMMKINPSYRICAKDILFELSKVPIPSIIRFGVGVNVNNVKFDITHAWKQNLEMRDIVIDWIFKRCFKKKVIHCLPLAIHLIDNYLYIERLNNQDPLLLISVSAILIAEAIFEGTYTSLPRWSNIIYDDYTAKDIEDQTRRMLSSLHANGTSMFTTFFDKILRIQNKKIYPTVVKWIVSSRHCLESSEAEKVNVYMKHCKNFSMAIQSPCVQSITKQFRGKIFHLGVKLGKIFGRGDNIIHCCLSYIIYNIE
jgi:serine/threonine protein kinase